MHQYVNSKNAKDLKFLIRKINTLHPDSKDTFKYHCSAGPWDLKKSQGRHLQILTKEEKPSPSHLQTVCIKWYPLYYWCVIYSISLSCFVYWVKCNIMVFALSPMMKIACNTSVNEACFAVLPALIYTWWTCCCCFFFILEYCFFSALISVVIRSIIMLLKAAWYSLRQESIAPGLNSAMLLEPRLCSSFWSTQGGNKVEMRSKLGYSRVPQNIYKGCLCLLLIILLKCSL